jgi:hypothetical protein
MPLVNPSRTVIGNVQITFDERAVDNRPLGTTVAVLVKLPTACASVRGLVVNSNREAALE